jgi:hypothetical protein
MGGDPTGIAVSCMGDEGIKCGASYCAVGHYCCFGANTCDACATTQKMYCDDTKDCAATVGSICCGRLTGGGNTVKDAVCLALADCMMNMGGYEVLCDPNAPGGDTGCDATTGTTCAAATKFVGYNKCQP